MRQCKTISAMDRYRRFAAPQVESLEDRNCPAPFAVVGATGSPDSILPLKVFDASGAQVATVQPFNTTTSIRVATGDFNGDGIDNEVAVLGRRTDSDLRAEIVTYNMNTSTGALTETNRFFAFPDSSILGNGYITTGDFDGDGDDDIAVAQIGGGRTVVTLQTFLSNGDGINFTAGGSTTIDYGTISAPRIGAGDTDNDGQDEIVVAARTDAGAGVRVFDAATGTPVQQGTGFTWTFGVANYNRGAFVAVGEFDPTSNGAEIVLGSNVGGQGRVDVVSYDGAGAATLVENGRFTPFGDPGTTGYNAAVRVSIGTVKNGDVDAGQAATQDFGVNVIISGQDRFQSGLAAVSQRNFDLSQNPQDPTNPEFTTGPTFTVLSDSDGLGPDVGSADRTLGPFVASANTTLVHGKALRQANGDLNSFTVADLSVESGFGNVIPAGQTAAIAIDASNLAIPTGFNFQDLANSLYIHFVMSGSAGDLSNVDLDVRFYVNATTPGVNDNRIEIVNVGSIMAATSVFSGQFAPGATVAINAAVPLGTLIANVVGTGAEPLNQFFLPTSTANFGGTGFFTLDVDNSGGTGALTFDEFDLYFNFA